MLGGSEDDYLADDGPDDRAETMAVMGAYVLRDKIMVGGFRAVAESLGLT